MPFTLFISDLHLTPEQPATLTLFRRFLDEIAPGADALYILGDFFEVWLGDDDLDTPPHAAIAIALKALSDAGTRIAFLHGNRDFLLGDGFAQAAGMTLLPDPVVIDLYGESTLISHGDAWCTDDVDYQAFRRQVRDPAWQQGFLARPLAERRAIARGLREQSMAAQGDKLPEITDVHPEAIAAAMRDYQVAHLIHGHTHRPARHTLVVDGRACERWVLADWYTSGGYLRCQPDGWQLVTLSPTT